jgi:hypothetical protein
MDLRLIDFDSPSEVREFEKCRFEVYEVGPMILGRLATSPVGSGRSTSGPHAESLCARSNM